MSTGSIVDRVKNSADCNAPGNWLFMNPSLCRVSSAHAAATSFHHQSTLPGSSADTASAGYFCRPLKPGRRLRMRFLLSHATAAAAKTGTVRLWGLSELPNNANNTDYIGEYIGDLSLVAGTTAIADPSFVIRNAGEQVHWASTITATVDESAPPGMAIYADASNCGAVVQFDPLNFVALVADLRIGTAEGIAAMFNVC